MKANGCTFKARTRRENERPPGGGPSGWTGPGLGTGRVRSEVAGSSQVVHLELGRVSLRAHDSVHGLGGAEITLDLTR